MFKSGFYSIDSNRAWFLVKFALQNKHLGNGYVSLGNVLRWHNTIDWILVKHQPHLVYRRQTIYCDCPLHCHNKQLLLHHLYQVYVVSGIVLSTVGDYVWYLEVVQVHSNHRRTHSILSPWDHKSNGDST